MALKHFKPGQSGNPAGRPASSRNRLTVRVFEDVLKHWTDPCDISGAKARGPEALQRMYVDKPVEYVRAVLSILPKELQVESITTGMTEEERAEMIAALKQHLLARQEQQPLQIEAKPIHEPATD